MIAMYNWIKLQFYRVPSIPRNLMVTVLFQAIAYLVSGVLMEHTGGENNSALVYVLAVALTSLLTTGYLYGIVSSLVGGFCINYYFMIPYSAFSLSHTGYPVAMLSMVLISCVVCALTSRVKLQAQEAVKREQNTKALYEMNAKLNGEKAAIQREADREAIRANILRSVSHDLRTPLTAISGAATVLLTSEDTSPRNVSMIQDIKTDAEALTTMVENLLSVTRIQDDSFPLQTREEMLEEVAGDAVITVRRRFPHAKIQLDLSADILYLPMDPLLIRQVIVNLLENAIKHSGDLDHIHLRLYPHGNWAVTEVCDQGCGLSPDVIRAVIEQHPLSRDETGDSTRGMGIGLSVCHSIVLAHGGVFSAENGPEGGAVVRFALPMEEKEL